MRLVDPILRTWSYMNGLTFHFKISKITFQWTLDGAAEQFAAKQIELRACFGTVVVKILDSVQAEMSVSNFMLFFSFDPLHLLYLQEFFPTWNMSLQPYIIICPIGKRHFAPCLDKGLSKKNKPI